MYCSALLVLLVNMVEQRVNYDRSGFYLYSAFICCTRCKSSRVERWREIIVQHLASVAQVQLHFCCTSTFPFAQIVSLLLFIFYLHVLPWTSDKFSLIQNCCNQPSQLRIRLILEVTLCLLPPRSLKEDHCSVTELVGCMT